MSNSSNTKIESPGKVSAFRRVLPQIIAATAQAFHSIDTGLVLCMPTIVIPALTGIQNEHNRNELLRMTKEQASWIGSIEYLFLPFGSLAAGLITDILGRKWATLLMNIPFIAGWFLLYQASAVWQIFIGFALLGFSIGLTVQVSVYFGEMCEPSVRGTLIGYANILGTLVGFLGLLLNTLVPWRTVALICLAVPLICGISLCFVPETPQWLLAKNRDEDAERSLCWLRGWVPKQNVSREFQELRLHSEHSKSCDSCMKQNQKCIHPLPTLWQKILDLKQRRTLRPFMILVALFFFNQFTGVYAMRPFIVEILKAYNSPIPPDEAAAIMSFTDSLANVVFMCSIHLIGKRLLFLTTASGAILSAFVISLYGFIMLPFGTHSLEQSHQSQYVNNEIGYIPIICLILWSFFSFCGFISLPWAFTTEIFPFRSRVVAGTIVSIINSLFGFISKKMYYSLETTFSLPGVSLFYCVICVAGLILMYFILPETEGRSLQDIEMHFSDKSKKITDWKISKTSNQRENI